MKELSIRFPAGKGVPVSWRINSKAKKLHPETLKRL